MSTAIDDPAAVPAYTLVRSARRRRTIEISLHPVQGLLVKAPARASRREIDAFVARKARWVRRALDQARDQERHLHLQFVTGESLPYLGRSLQLHIEFDACTPGVERVGDRLEVRLALSNGYASDRRAETIAAIERWYIAQAGEVLAGCIRLFAPRAGVEPKRVAVKAQKTRWGSCGKNGALYFNWRLVLAPLAVVEYLAVHELCHLRQAGHGKRFWQLVAEVLPDFAAREAELRRDGWKYRLS